MPAPHRKRNRRKRVAGIPPDFVPVRDIIGDLMKQLGMQDKHWLTVLADEWPGIVGKPVATHSRPGRVNERHLVIFVDSSVWLNELSRYGREQLLRNLKTRFGADKIQSVSFQLDPDARGR